MITGTLLACLMQASTTAAPSANELGGTLSPVIHRSIQDDDTKTASEAPETFVGKLGLAYTAPPNCIANEQRNDRGVDVLHLVDESTPPGWTITFQRLGVQEMGETAGSRIDSFLASLPDPETAPAGTPLSTVRERRALGVRLMGGTEAQRYPAELVYLDVELDETTTGISGLLVIQIDPTTFLYGTLFALGDTFEERSKASLETLFDSLRILSGTDKTERESTRIENGSVVVSAFTPELLRAVAEKDVNDFYRLYATSPDGTVKEVGWQQVTTRLASCAEVPGTTAGEDVSMEQGLLVTIKSEIVEFFPSQKLTVDVVGSHWISLDRAESRWSIIRTPRRILSAGARRTETEVGSPSAETGIRTRPQPRSTITVVDSNGLNVQLDAPADDTPFITQAELYVLGHLLAASGTGDFDLDWYALDRQSLNGAGIRKRSDRCTVAADGSFELTSIGGSGAFTQGFSETGARLMRRSPLDDGGELILESTDPETLIELYTRKQLPVR